MVASCNGGITLNMNSDALTLNKIWCAIGNIVQRASMWSYGDHDQYANLSKSCYSISLKFMRCWKIRNRWVLCRCWKRATPKFPSRTFWLENCNFRSAISVYINWTIEMNESISFRYPIHKDVFPTHFFLCSTSRNIPAIPWSSSVLCKCLINKNSYLCILILT